MTWREPDIYFRCIILETWNKDTAGLIRHVRNKEQTIFNFLFFLFRQGVTWLAGPFVFSRCLD
jgi:hypothetical protein